MRKLIAFVATVLVAGSALATDVKVEGRYGLDGAGKGNQEYLVVASGMIGDFNVGAEGQMKQAKNQGAVSSSIVGQLGLPVKAFGLSVQPYAELGKKLNVASNYMMYGLGVKGSLAVGGGLAVNAGARYRGDLGNAQFNETRYNAGLSYTFLKSNTIGADYYTYRSGTHYEAVGVSYKHVF